MKKKLIYLLQVTMLLIVSLLVMPISSYAQNEGKELTLMTYNIQGNYVINSRQLDKLATVISSANPDVVAVQEVSQKWVKDCAEQLGIKTDMKSIYLITHNTNYGIVLLSKEEPLNVINHLIPKGAESTDPDDNRGIIIAEFPDYYFISTHYSLNADDRDTATDYIIRFVKSVDKPVFLGGDLNIKETYRAMVTFKNNGFMILNDTKINTYPSTEPASCIDYIMVYNKTDVTYEIKETGIADQHEIDLTTASDHLPIYVKLQLHTTTGIHQKELNEIILSKTDDGFLFSNLLPNTTIQLYSIDGKLLFSESEIHQTEYHLMNPLYRISLLKLINNGRINTYKLIY